MQGILKIILIYNLNFPYYIPNSLKNPFVYVIITRYNVATREYI